MNYWGEGIEQQQHEQQHEQQQQHLQQPLRKQRFLSLEQHRPAGPHHHHQHNRFLRVVPVGR
jgi:hypothetical protein